jgi:hypothetical protein
MSFSNLASRKPVVLQEGSRWCVRTASNGHSMIPAGDPKALIYGTHVAVVYPGVESFSRQSIPADAGTARHAGNLAG